MAAGSYETLLYGQAEGVATVRLNRPDRLNAFTATMRRELINVFDHTDRDDEVRAVVVTGEGRAFCAGADLSRGAETFDFERQPDLRDGWDVVNGVARDGGGQLVLRMFDSLKPIIGAINGAAVGIGATMLLPMDVRLASQSARFGFAFSRRGMTPDGVASWFLPRVVGVSAALDWALSGRMVSADEAHTAGLVRAVHPPEALLQAAYAYAAELVEETAPVSVALIRQMFWRGLTVDHPMKMHGPESRALRARGASGDPKEGVAAFLEKRRPAFPDTVSDGLPDVFPSWVDPPFE